MTTKIRELAPAILIEVKKAKSILLHFHPSPDPDSVGAALAMKFALEQLGKKASVIKGDSEFPEGFKHFPGTSEIIRKNFFETNINDYDLFIVLDSARIEMVSRRGNVVFPPTLKTIAIDHHVSNSMFCSINLVDSSYVATCELLFDLMKEWEIEITADIAQNLFIGMYADTGGFKYPGVKPTTYKIASELSAQIPSIPNLVSKMENSNTPSFLAFQGAALERIEVSAGGKFAISYVSKEVLKDKKISAADIRTSDLASLMLTVKDWEVVASAVELEPNKIKFSFRSKDQDKYDVAKLTEFFGGGGHKAAAGLILEMPLEDAKKAVVSKVKEMYNL